MIPLRKNTLSILVEGETFRLEPLCFMKVKRGVVISQMTI